MFRNSSLKFEKDHSKREMLLNDVATKSEIKSKICLIFYSYVRARCILSTLLISQKFDVSLSKTHQQIRKARA